jgi:glycopeptide antibiotics resistance protein
MMQKITSSLANFERSNILRSQSFSTRALSPGKAISGESFFAWLALPYLLFIVYGSLLPFEWNNLAFAAAWARFQHIPFLQLGEESRADWVANLLLYIPLGFLVCGWLIGQSRRALVLAIGMSLSLLFSAAVAVGVEFTQEFFPPRTVSLNDIYAECVGGALGAVLWPFIGMRLTHLARAIFQGGQRARYATLIAYGLAYLVLSLFPYDFLLSFAEWQRQLTSDNVGWLFAPNCGSDCWLKLVAEAFAVVPFGMLAVLVFGRRVSLPLAAVAGLLLGVMIEGLQLSIASGISQGASIPSRGVGVMLGVALLRLARGFEWRRMRGLARPMLVLGAVPYLAALAWGNHWLSESWLTAQAGLARLAGINFLPFYYHYYTSESMALVSLLYQFGLYLPIGAAVWLWCWAGRSGKCAHPYASPALAAAIPACVIEAGKLFIASQHPDPTNVLIAATAAIAAHGLLRLLLMEEALSPSVAQPQPASVAPEQAVRRAVIQPHSLWAWLIGIAALCAALVAGATSPLGMVQVLVPLIAYAALLWWRPGLWLVLVPALLPLLDFTPCSGRLYWTEFDTLLMATLGVGYLRLRPSRQPVMRLPGKLLLAVFSLSAAISLGLGLFPLSALDLNAFANYTSSFNALRAAKGLFFALAFTPFLARAWDDPALAARRLALGMMLGLALEVLYVLWERVTFSGLFNFVTDYRITGSFPGMHIGGAYIEGYLVTALPFVLLWAWYQRHVAATVLAVVLYALGAYSVMVTFARGGQVAFIVTTLIAIFGFARLALRDRARRFVAVGALLLIGGAAAVVAWPIFSGKYSESRLATSSEDITIRLHHWSDALNILRMRHTPVFGLGLGTFPAAYFWGSSEPSRPATYSFLSENGNVFLRLGSGDTLYFEQPVAVAPERHYILSMDLRSSAKNAALTTPVCEKALLYSFTCVWPTLQLKGTPGQWAHYETPIRSANFGPPRSLFPRPVKLSLFNGRSGTLVDVDNVALRDEAGDNLMRNGNFSTGMQHWFFSTDSHLAWHAKNLFIHVLFEQGWLGLICFLALLAYTLARLLKGARALDPLSLTLFTSLTAFLLVGMIDSLIDETRIGFLFYLMVIAGLIAEARLKRV